MQRVCRPLACALMVAATTPVAAAAWTLDAAAWARPRSGSTIVAMTPLPKVIEAWSRRPGDRIVIRHPGGEDGEIWAAELRDWLIALGIPGRSIEVTGGGEPEQLAIALR